MIIDIVLGTPWWAFVLLAYLIFIGVKALKPQTMPLRQVFILPGIFLIWGLFSLKSKVGSFIDIGIWAASIAAGAWLGWKWVRHVSVSSTPKGPVAKVPGGPATLILVLSIFTVKYFFGYSYATNPAALADLRYVVSDIILSGLLTGMLLGRALHYWYKWKS